MLTYTGTNPRVILRLIKLGAQIERRRSRGRSTMALEFQVDAVIKAAHAKERRR